jgi:hypothetical protein
MRPIFFLFFVVLAGCARQPIASTTKSPTQQFIAALHEGDLLFQNLPCGSLCDAIIETTPCDDAYAFNHCAIFRYEKGQPVVVEAIGKEVQQTPLSVFLQRDTASRLSVGRIDNRDIAGHAAQRSLQYLGRPYDDVFLTGDSALYCSELVWESFRDGAEPIFTLKPMTFRSGGRTHSGWVQYFMKLNAAIPEGELGINPCAIAGSDKVRLLSILKTELRPLEMP